jgi:DNA ligase-1
MNPSLLTSDIPADPTGWHLSEKLDGARSLFSGTRYLSRNGHVFRPPAEWFQGMPDCRLDGELFMGCGTFPALVSTIQRRGSDWKGVMFCIFDLAESGTFEERLERLSKLVLPSHCRLVAHRLCAGRHDLDQTERQIVSAGGEGCVLRRPGSLYRPGRAGDVVKIKRLTPDHRTRSALD